MTEQIKPKQCGENAWYIPNQKGFVPNQTYWFCREDGTAYRTIHFTVYDYAMVDAGNCFETEQEARDAFVKPADPTPITWDELCKISDGYDKAIAFKEFENIRPIWYIDTRFPTGLSTIYPPSIVKRGRLTFEADVKYWRSKESFEAWIEKKKGE